MQLFAQQMVFGILIGSLYALTALGVTVQWRAMSLMCFAYGEFCMLGAFASMIFTLDVGLPFWVSFLLSIALVGLLGAVTERFIYRPLRDGPLTNPMVAFVGCSIIIQQLALIRWGAEGRTFPSPFGEQAIVFAGLRFVPQYVVTFGVSVVLMILLDLFLNRTKMGVALRAVSQDRETARLMGINLGRMHALTLAMTGGLGAAAGSLYGPMSIVIFNMGMLIFLKGFIAAAFGGLGNVRATILGGLCFGVIEQLSAAFVSSLYRDCISFGLMVLIITFKPAGLFGKRLVAKV
ncbi:MAG: branched-chain amino acid ABC transporter permease [Bacillota bacterium]